MERIGITAVDVTASAETYGDSHIINRQSVTVESNLLHQDQGWCHSSQKKGGSVVVAEKLLRS